MTELTLDAIEMARTRDDVVPLYAAGIRDMQATGRPPDVSAINAAIVRKWSPYALSYIKERAWKLAASRQGDER